MGATTSTPLAHTPAPALADELSSTSLAPVQLQDAKNLMAEDQILSQQFYTSLSSKPKQDLYKCILFVYGFMMEKRSWVRVERLEEGSVEITEMDQAELEPADRIALVRELTNNEDCRVRLLQIATGNGEDDDLMKAEGTIPLIENYLRSLFRFFSKQNSFGFKDNMEDVVWSLCDGDQSCENCFLITACEFVDLQIQKDLVLEENEKLKCFDKSQVARRTMSATDLASYVIMNSGNSGLALVEQMLGGSDEISVLQKFDHSQYFVFRTARNIDHIFNEWRLDGGRIGYVTFNVTGLKPADNQGQCKIPCFDQFDPSGRIPPTWLSLESKAQGEDKWLEKQMTRRQSRPLHAQRNSSLFHANAQPPPLFDNAKPSGTTIDKGFTCSNSSDVPFGDNAESSGTSHWYTMDHLALLFTGMFTGIRENQKGEEEKDLEEYWVDIDKTASTADAAGSDLPARDVRHSVTMIGGFEDEHGKKWYCMKNSWKTMPLFLASSNWLAAAKANCACTVGDRIKAIPTGYKRTDNRFSSCASPLVNEEGDWKSSRPGLDDGFWSGP